MNIRVVNLEEKSRSIKELHKYKLVAELNDYQFKMVKARCGWLSATTSSI